MEISSNEIEFIVKKVIAGLDSAGVSPFLERTSPQKPIQISDAGSDSELGLKHKVSGQHGVFERIEDAIDEAYQAQKNFITNYKIYDRQRIIDAIRRAARENVETFSSMIVEETKMGRYEDKLEKHLAVINKTPGPECLTTEAISGDEGLMLEECAPFGVIGAITPTTNPTETIINNTISMIAGGNSVVFNVHPTAKKVSAFCLQVLNQAIVEAGGPVNLITMAKEPTMENVNTMAASLKIRMMVGTGGTAMVTALLRSGKKTIGAGAGNPPVIVDETADVELAAKEIYKGASFDNNILCFAEKEAFVLEHVYGEFLHNMKKEGAFLLEPDQVKRLVEVVLKPGKQGLDINKAWVGRDASELLKQIGVAGVETKLLLCQVSKDHPFVQVEQMMPVLPIVKCRNFEEAVLWAVEAEQGNRHTASIFSRDVDHMTRFARAIETTIYVKNRATMAGVGIRGEGHCTMTIAGPTGEGITNARSFTRKRRCMLAEGGLRII